MRFMFQRGATDLRIPTLMGLVVMLLSGTPHSTLARQATPEATPGIAVCDVAPRTVADMLALLGSEVPAGGQVLEPQPLPPGVPADAATTEAITAVVRELEACSNTGDQLRIYALFSDDQFRQIPPSAEIVDELRALEAATPAAVPVGQRQVIVGPWHVEKLADGRVMAAVQFRWEGEVGLPNTTKALLFVQQDDQWLLQEMLNFVWVEDGADGATMVPVEDVVGSPPGT